MRTVLGVVRRVSDPADTDALRASPKQCGALLGEARDAEMRADRAAALLDERSIADSDARRRLVGDERSAYRHAQQRLVEAQESEASRDRVQLVREVGLHLEVDDVSAKKAFSALIEREVRRLKQAAKKTDGSLDRFHELRKAARRLRYLAEAIDRAEPSLFGDELRMLGRAARRVRKRLGEHRDDTLLSEGAGQMRPRAFRAQEDTAPYDAVAEAATARAEEHLKALPKAAGKVKKAARRFGCVPVDHGVLSRRERS